MSNIYFSPEERADYKSEKIESLEDGDYQGLLYAAQFKLLGKEGERFKKVCVTYKIEKPETHYGRDYVHFLPLQKGGFKFLKFVLKQFGVDPDAIGIDDIVNELTARSGAEVHFSLQTEGKYQNCKLKDVFLKSSPDADDINF